MNSSRNHGNLFGSNIDFNQSITSEDFVEAVAARIQKRDPDFKGR